MSSTLKKSKADEIERSKEGAEVTSRRISKVDEGGPLIGLDVEFIGGCVCGQDKVSRRGVYE